MKTNNKSTRNKETSFDRKGSKPKWKSNSKFDKKSHFQQPKSKTLLVKPGTLWQEKSVDLKPSEYEKSPSTELERFRKQAEKLLEDDVVNYKISLTERKEKADFGWIQTVLKSGTLADKMAAHTMLIQDSPVHCLASVEMLSGLVNTKGKRECILAMDTLRDLFLSNLLIADRKLKSFDTRPLSKLDEISGGNKETKSRQLLLWWFEDRLKQTYKNFLHALETVTHDQVEKTKEKAISVVADLLMHNPEQEQYLLQKLVNKIGDPVNRVSGKVVHLLNKVVDSHPNMKLVIVEEVERLLFRPNIGAKAQYYTLCFLNQLILSPDDVKLAAHLIKVYFAFFKVCVKKGEVDSKMMSALLTGTSRAFPFAKQDNTNKLMEQLDTLFKVVHIVNFNTSVQCLMLIFQALDTNDGPSDRFYSTLYKMVLDPDLAFSSRQTMFLNLLFRSIKKDPVERRVKAFYKRLLQVCHYLSPPLVCGILFLISETLKSRPNLLSFTQNYVATISDNNAIDGNDDDDEEHYSDVPLEDEDGKKVMKKTKKKVTPSWVHIHSSKVKSNKSSEYRPTFWNPLYCGAENEASWELMHLLDHFHPSVSLFATNLLQKKSIQYTGDPLQDFTLIHFLDRFVFRNPKKPTDRMKEDLHQRVFGRRKFYASSGTRSMPLSSESYLHQKEENIPVEERFMYRYLLQQTEEKKKKKSKKQDGDDDHDDVESVASEDFEKLLDKLEPGSWDNIDFASEVQKGGGGGKSKKGQVDDDDDDDEDELSEEDFANDEDFKQAFEEYDEELEGLEDDDEEDFVGGKFEEGSDDMEEENCEDDNDGEDDFEFDKVSNKRLATKGQKRERGGKKRKINNSNKFDTSNMFASAEEFADLLEENADTKLDTIGSQALSNKDKADVKQLNWEMSRDKWVKGVDWKKKKNFRRGGGKESRGKKTFKAKRK